MPHYEIDGQSQIRELRETIQTAAAQAVATIVGAIDGKSPLTALASLKFDEVGFHPTEERRLNLIEQVNQTFTYLASLAAVERVLGLHPESAPIHLNLGTSGGFDVASPSESIVAEVFAAVRRNNNQNLVTDVARVAGATERHKYVFSSARAMLRKRFRLELFPDVQIFPLTQAELWRGLDNDA